MSRRVVLILSRVAALVVGLLTMAASPRIAQAAGCHRGDRPIVDQFQALWVNATEFDPLAEPAAPLPQAGGSHLTHKPCSTPAPHELAPGHANHPAHLRIEPDLAEPPPPAADLLRGPLAPYENPLSERLRRPPRLMIAV